MESLQVEDKARRVRQTNDNNAYFPLLGSPLIMGLEKQDLWFSDGSIVTRVGERICRVHQSILAVNLSFLADMHSIPQPGNAETFDGLPMMDFPDPPEEVLHWLKYMSLPGYVVATILFPAVSRTYSADLG